MFSGVTATTSTLFLAAYPSLSESEIGLCFLAIGSGMVIGGPITGKLMDRDWRKMERRYEHIDSDLADAETGAAVSRGVSEGDGKRKSRKVKDKNDLPIEKTRMRGIPVYFMVLIGCTMGYGWCVEQRVHLAVPLVLQFFSESEVSLWQRCHVSVTSLPVF